MTAFLEMTNVSKVFSAGIIRRQHTVAVDDVTMTIDEAVAVHPGRGRARAAAARRRWRACCWG